MSADAFNETGIYNAKRKHNESKVTYERRKKKKKKYSLTWKMTEMTAGPDLKHDLSPNLPLHSLALQAMCRHQSTGSQPQHNS